MSDILHHLVSEFRNNTNTRKLFGIIMFLNYILYFFVFDYNTPHANVSILLRGLASTLCIPLMFRKFSYDDANIYKKLYWYLVVAYCLPFFFTFMTLLNHLSTVWLMNTMSAAFLMILVVNLRMFFILLATGSITAMLLYSYGFKYSITIDQGMVSLSNITATYFAVIIIGSIFAYNKESMDNERRKVSNKIQDLNSKLMQTLTAKTEFLNNLNHEIRTPIQGFTNISEGLVLHWKEFDDQIKLEFASQIASNAKRLASLVGNLLDMSKFSAGKMLLDLQKLDLNEIIKTIIDECQTLYINDKQIKIRFVKKHNTAEIIADHERVAQVLRNLFVNAIKFSSNNDTIIANLTKSELNSEDQSIPAFRVSITDQGVGIPEDELEVIFTPFAQSKRTKTKAGGTGLGLAICHEIITAHNGQIWAENNEKGATFHFLIPITSEKQETLQKFKSANNFKINLTDPSKPITILIVDDEETCLITMELLLRDSGHHLVKSSGGYAALEYLQANPNTIDIILLDLMMPDMYGLNVLSEIQKDDNLAKIPVILQSGTSDVSEIERAYQMGIASYIKKPYTKEAVTTEIKKILSSVSKNS